MHGTLIQHRQPHGTRNALLQLLGREDYALIDAWLIPTQLHLGELLYVPGHEIQTIYFPTDTVVAMLLELGPRRSIETALIGNEGIIGWPAVVGCSTPSHRYIVTLNSGSALAMPAQKLRAACVQSSQLLATIMRFVDTLTVQMSFAMASHMCETVERRLARWILTRDDRSSTDELKVRHCDISENLAIRRASVTDALHILEGDRLIRCQRGRLVVRDRPALEERAGTTYIAWRDRSKRVEDEAASA